MAAESRYLASCHAYLARLRFICQQQVQDHKERLTSTGLTGVMQLIFVLEKMSKL